MWNVKTSMPSVRFPQARHWLRSLHAVKQFVTSLNLTGAAIASDNSSGSVASAWTVFVVREENTTTWNVY